MKKSSLVVSFMALVIPLTIPLVSRADVENSNASDHAPISVMGDHLHQQGEWMMSYRYMHMDMQGSLVGTNEISNDEIVGTESNPAQFMVAPTEMPMQMHMLGIMYGVSDRITLFAMANFVRQEMSHITRAGGSFVTQSSGIGDAELGVLISILDNHFHRLHANISVSLPTGSIVERDDTPLMNNAFLPYPMQLGSGTYDFIPGITYSGHSSEHIWKWGAQMMGTIRADTNDEGYSLGDRLELNAWLARNFSDNLSISLGFKYQQWQAIEGANSALNPLLIQTANTSLQSGDRIDLSVGANYRFNSGHRLAIEYAQDVAQDLDGPQLKTESVFTIGWQKQF
ncbi:MAG: transporter [Acidiferrobacterales bacterium]|nr:transporter [Acidiferrobacterales bacterium]